LKKLVEYTSQKFASKLPANVMSVQTSKQGFYDLT